MEVFVPPAFCSLVVEQRHFGVLNISNTVQYALQKVVTKYTPSRVFTKLDVRAICQTEECYKPTVF